MLKSGNLLENTEPVIILDFNRKLQEFPSLSLPVSYLAPRWSTAGLASGAARAALGAPPARPPLPRSPRWERRRPAGPSAPPSLGAPPAGRPVRTFLAYRAGSTGDWPIHVHPSLACCAGRAGRRPVRVCLPLRRELRPRRTAHCS